MKNIRSSVKKQVPGDHSIALFAIAIGVFSVVVLWQVISVFYGQVMDLVSMQQLTASVR